MLMTGTTNSRWNRNVIAQQLHDNLRYSAALALAFFNSKKENYGWEKALWYYNTGRTDWTKSGQRYARSIKAKIAALKKSGMFERKFKIGEGGTVLAQRF